MPNKRHKDKVNIGFWIPRKIKAALEQEAKRTNMTLTDFQRAMIMDYLKLHGYDVENKKESETK